MATPVVQYIMLTSILAPHVYNLVTISLVRSKESGCLKGMGKGIVLTVMLALGFHELRALNNNSTFDLARNTFVIFEDCPQLVLSIFNTLSLGASFTFITIVTPALSFKAVFSKFCIENIIIIPDPVIDVQRELLFKGDVTQEKWRFSRCWAVMSMIYVTVIGTIAMALSVFFRFASESVWFADREWLARPSLVHGMDEAALE